MIRDASQYATLVEDVQKMIEKVATKEGDSAAFQELENSFFDLWSFMVIYDEVSGRDLRKVVEYIQSNSNIIMVSSEGYDTLFFYARGSERDLSEDLRSILQTGSKLLKSA